MPGDENEVKPWKPENVRDVIAERIKTQFIDLMPDDVFKKHVQTEIDDFFKAKKNQYNHQGPATSLFQKIIQAEIESRFKALIKSELDKPEFQGTWDGKRQVAGEAIEKMIARLVPDLVTATFTEVVERVVSNIRNQM